MRDSLAKAEYLFRPSQLARRLRLAVTGVPADEVTVRLPWGWPMRVNPNENIGRALLTLGIYDLVVSETLYRLLDPGETAVDAGANVGSMSAVLAHRAGRTGTIHAFEPHPELSAKLAANVAAWREAGCEASLVLHRSALSDTVGTAELHVPKTFSSNSGLSSLSLKGAGRTVTVETQTLDAFFRGQPPPSLMKLDVEGHEARLLAGARRLLAGRKTRDVLFEENDPSNVESRRLLEGAGYRLFLLQRRLWRPLLRPFSVDALVPTWEPPTFLATLDPARAEARLAGWGWRVLR